MEDRHHGVPLDLNQMVLLLTDTVGLYCGSGQSKRIRLCTREGRVWCFDKKQNIAVSPHLDAIDRFIDAARVVRAARCPGPDHDVHILMYLNALIDFPEFQHLHNKTVSDPSLLLSDSAGKPIKLRGNRVFDPRSIKTRQLFVNATLYGMRSGVFNGVFIDRADWASSSKCQWGSCDLVSECTMAATLCDQVAVGQRLLLSELSAVLGEGNLTLAKETSGAPMIDWQVANAVMTSDTFCSHYCHNCNASVTPNTTWKHPKDSTICANSIELIYNMSLRGQLSQSHAIGPIINEEARLFTIACFLMGAGDLSYFSYANWSIDSWELNGTRWWPEYARELGRPTSPGGAGARVKGKRWKYERSFESGTMIKVDVATRVVEIKWGGGKNQ